MRINILGGPGTGKSTTTARVFSELKSRHVNIEMVTEYVKSWVYLGRKIKEWDQIYIFGKQQQYEYRWLSHGVNNIITDSPCFLCSVYAKMYYGSEMGDALWTLCKLYDAKHPVFNIFLERGNLSYQPVGRYQPEEEARSIDNAIWKELTDKYDSSLCARIDATDHDAVLKKVLEVCE